MYFLTKIFHRQLLEELFLKQNVDHLIGFESLHFFKTPSLMAYAEPTDHLSHLRNRRERLRFENWSKKSNVIYGRPL